MEILTSVKRLYISFKSLVNDFVYSFGRAALLLLVEVQNHTVPVRERGRIRVNLNAGFYSSSGCWDNVVTKITRLWPGQSGFQILEKARYFSLVQNFQTDSRDQRASYSISKGLFPKHKAGLV